MSPPSQKARAEQEKIETVPSLKGPDKRQKPAGSEAVTVLWLISEAHDREYMNADMPSR